MIVGAAAHRFRNQGEIERRGSTSRYHGVRDFSGSMITSSYCRPSPLITMCEWRAYKQEWFVKG